jgi:hypothetical protein
MFFSISINHICQIFKYKSINLVFFEKVGDVGQKEGDCLELGKVRLKEVLTLFYLAVIRCAVSWYCETILIIRKLTLIWFLYLNTYAWVKNIPRFITFWTHRLVFLTLTSCPLQTGWGLFNFYPQVSGWRSKSHWNRPPEF